MKTEPMEQDDGSPSSISELKNETTVDDCEETDCSNEDLFHEGTASVGQDRSP